MPTSKDGHFYFSWFPTIYAAATQHLSLAEDGAYRRLLDHYMTTKQPLPDNDASLARIAGVGKAEWDAVKNAVKTYFKPSINPAGYLHHTFCEQELGLHTARMDKAKNNGKKGGRPKSLISNENKPLGFENETQQKAEHNITEHNIRDRANALPLVESDKKTQIHDLPDWLPKDDWQAFKEMRKAIKKPMTERAEQMLIKKLQAMKSSPSLILQQSIINCWQDIYELKGTNETHQRTSGGSYPTGGGSYGRKEPFKRNVETIGGKK